MCFAPKRENYFHSSKRVFVTLNLFKNGLMCWNANRKSQICLNIYKIEVIYLLYQEPSNDNHV